ncbi:glycogen synthase GlgA [Chitinilyticum piscinae]|uniref:Glycogen synthase n=1 Tax=Chitinilyticum piscinae TaxID=2866724 RepID=A0A8J7FJ32_9NEIS|nr:glycogen synthase GlgA [Chitinilyticum piscinae]MBE9610233.1 glycogen synthase GlgA [Chitinilyticum piscinae]
MRILHVAAELFPLLKTGGLADVAGALPLALAPLGVDVRVLLPAFPAIRAGVSIEGEVATFAAPMGAGKLLFGRTADGVAVYLIDAPAYYDRPGNPYHDAEQRGYGDNHLRFALLGWVAAQLAQGMDAYWSPVVVHAHDWHAALAPAYLAASGRPAKSVITVHNLAYQGVFGRECFDALGLPPSFFDREGVEFHGNVSFLKAGLFYADHITTVSPSYAREITTAEQGCGLEGLLQARRSQLSGILNGVDEAVWNPASDDLLPATYSADKMTGKGKCKAALQHELGLDVQDAKPLFVVVSRLTDQKGLPLLLEVLPELLARGGQFALLGSGDAWLEEAFRQLAHQHPRQLAVKLGYDEAFSHRLIAAGDVIMVPSRFEPCGLTQLYGLKYGTLPLVRRVGGLADTVSDCSLENLADDCATGFVFRDLDVPDCLAAVRRTFALWERTREWKNVRKRAMLQSVGWQESASHYVTLYQQLMTA